MHPTQLPTDAHVPMPTPTFETCLPNIIEDDDFLPPRYNLRSQVNCAISTTPLPLGRVNAVLEQTTGSVLEYRHLVKGPDKNIWTTSCANDFGRLSQGVGTRMPSGTNTIFFVPFHKVPKD